MTASGEESTIYRVNDSIPQEWGSLKYTTFDEAVDALLQQGPWAILVSET